MVHKAHLQNRIEWYISIVNKYEYMFYFSFGEGVWQQMEIIFVKELPKDVLIRTEKSLLVGTGQKGVENHERLCPKEGK